MAASMCSRQWSSCDTHPDISWPSVIGTASWRCVRPILTIPANSRAFRSSVSRSVRTAGISRRRISATAAMCMAVGKVSLEDWLRLTSSFGWIGFFEPSSPPRISIARLAMTSLAFMLVCVPLPVCQTTSGKVVVELALDDLVAGLDDGLRLLGREDAALGVDDRAGLLEDAEGADHLPREALAADLEVGEGAFGLGAPVPIGRHLDLAHGVELGARLLVVAHRGAMLSRVGGGQRAPGIGAWASGSCARPSIPRGGRGGRKGPTSCSRRLHRGM